MPHNLGDTLNEAMKPMKDIMEPWKIHEETRERGTPILHEAYGKQFNYLKLI